MKKEYRIIISGGGTGGHIFPALSIADTIRSKHPEAKILFVGADNRMEMQRVPDAGYDIIGLPIAGLQRKLTMSNLQEPAYGKEDYQGVCTASCSRRRRICKRTYIENGSKHEDSYTYPGAELIRWCNEQDTVEESKDDLCRIRRHGTLLPS